MGYMTKKSTATTARPFGLARSLAGVGIFGLVAIVGMSLAPGFSPAFASSTPMTDVRTTPSPVYRTFSLGPYTLTIPTGLVYTDEALQVVVEGGTPGGLVDLQGAYLQTEFPTPRFDENGGVILRIQVGEIAQGTVQTVQLFMVLPEIQSGYFVVGEVHGAVRPSPDTTTTVAPTTKPPAGFSIDGPNTVQVGETFTATAGGLRVCPGFG
jgi:hypothetical protein